MVWPVTSAWAVKVAAGFELARRVEVWSAEGKQIGSLPITDGSVKDDWVSGARRSVSLSVPPSAAVRMMLQPGVELRVYSGINYGYRQPELLPQGCYPVTDTSITEKAASISLQATDRWQWVRSVDFPVPTSTTVGITIQSQIAQFIAGCGRWRLSDVQQLASSTAQVTTAEVFDTSQGGRAQACLNLADSIGVEVFVDRTGVPVIRDRAAVGVSQAAFRPGTGNRLQDATVVLSDVDVFNSVRAVSSNTDPAFVAPDFISSITDPAHPAYPRNGVYRTFQLVSAQFKDETQMKAAAEKMLTKVSRRARQVTVTAVAPDASLDGSDTVTLNLPSTGADEQLQIQSITHSLSAATVQDISLCSTRTAEDFNP